jgi:hypothetical protein
MNIKQVHPDYIEFENGHKYYHENYVKIMNDRNYDKGYRDGTRVEIHVAKVIAMNEGIQEKIRE